MYIYIYTCRDVHILLYNMFFMCAFMCPVCVCALAARVESRFKPAASASHAMCFRVRIMHAAWKCGQTILPQSGSGTEPRSPLFFCGHAAL